MLGTRKSSIQVTNTAIKNQLEKIKKVDIDIFKSGETEKSNYIYNIQTGIQAATPISIMYYDKQNPVIRFRIDVEKINLSSKYCTIQSAFIDTTYQIHPQLVVDDEETESGHFEVNAFLENPVGNHHLVVNVLVDKDNVQTKREFTYSFKVVQVLQKREIQIDVPIDSYRDALLNVTKLWLVSSKYDRVRRPDWAGFFDDRLRKYQMTDEGAQQVQKDLASAIKNKIASVYISDIKAKPLLAERGWDVSVESTDLSTQISTATRDSQDTHVIVSIDNDNVENVKELS